MDLIIKFWVLKFDGYGTLADWFGAIGTIGAVLVALIMPHYANKPKVKVIAECDSFLGVKAVNTGQSIVKIIETGFFIKNIHINMPDEESTYLQQGEDTDKPFSKVGLLTEILQNFPNGNEKYFKLTPYVRDSQGICHKGKPIKLKKKDILLVLGEVRQALEDKKNIF